LLGLSTSESTVSKHIRNTNTTYWLTLGTYAKWGISQNWLLFVFMITITSFIKPLQALEKNPEKIIIFGLKTAPRPEKVGSLSNYLFKAL